MGTFAPHSATVQEMAAQAVCQAAFCPPGLQLQLQDELDLVLVVEPVELSLVAVRDEEVGGVEPKEALVVHEVGLLGQVADLKRKLRK